MSGTHLRVTPRAVGGLFSLLFAPMALGADLCGSLSGSLTTAGSPYTVLCDISVASGDLLEVDAGVELRFSPGASLTVDGTLETNGSMASPVRLTCDAASPAAGCRGPIEVNGSAILTWTEIEFGESTRVTGLATVIDSTFEANFDGLTFDVGGAGSVSGGRFVNNGGPGLAILPGSGAVNVDGAEFDGNDVPVYVGQNCFPQISNLTELNSVNHGGVEIASFTPWTVGGTLGAAGLPYVVFGDLTFGSGATLTLEPGVTLKVNADLAMPRTMTFDGLVTSGTVSEPVTLTSLRDDQIGGDTNRDGTASAPAPGDWGGVLIPGTATLTNARLRYGSSSQVTGNATVTGGTFEANFDGLTFDAGGAGSVVGTRFVDNGGPGLAILPGSGSVSVDGAEFDGNDVPVYVGQNSFPALSNLSEMNSVNHGGIELSSFTPWTASGKLSDAGIPYVVFGDLTFVPGATLTLDPGATLKVNADLSTPRTLTFDGLVTNGTIPRPVTLTSLRDDLAGGDTNRDGTASAPAPGDWAGILLSGTATLNRTHLLYGSSSRVTGSATVTNSRFEANFEGLTFDAGGAGSVSGGWFIGNDGPGLAILPGSGSVSVDGSAFVGNEVPVYVGQNSFPQLSNLAESGSVHHGGVELSSSPPWTAGGTLGDAGIPYVVSGDLAFDPGATLTLDPGATLKVSVDAITPRSLTFGGLVANGTASAPVTITSLRDDQVGGDTNRDGTASVPARGDWQGIALTGGASHSVSSAAVRYADTGITADGGVLDCAGSRLQQNWTGIAFINGAGGTVSRTDVVDNGTGIYVDPLSLPVLGDVSDLDPANDGDNQFICNTVHVDSGNVSVLSAEGSWWMDAPPNPALIVGNVDVTPYLAQARNTLPGGLSVGKAGANLSIAWEDATTACGVQVLRSLSPTAGFLNVSGSLFGTSYSDAGAASDGNNYYYLVVAD